MKCVHCHQESTDADANYCGKCGWVIRQLCPYGCNRRLLLFENGVSPSRCDCGGLLKSCSDSECRLLYNESGTRCTCGDLLETAHQSWFTPWGNNFADSRQSAPAKSTATIGRLQDLKGPKILEIPVSAGDVRSLAISGGELFVACSGLVLWGDYKSLDTRATQSRDGNVPTTWHRAKISPAMAHGSLIRNGNELFVLNTDGVTSVDLRDRKPDFTGKKLLGHFVLGGKWVGIEGGTNKMLVRNDDFKLTVEGTPPVRAEIAVWANGFAILSHSKVTIYQAGEALPEVDLEFNAQRLICQDSHDRLLAVGMDGAAFYCAIIDRKTGALKALPAQQLPDMGTVISSTVYGVSAVDEMLTSLVSIDQEPFWVNTSLRQDRPFAITTRISGITSLNGFSILPRGDETYALHVGGREKGATAYFGFHRLDDARWKTIDVGNTSLNGAPVAAAYADGRLFIACNRSTSNNVQAVVYEIEVEV